MDKRQQELKNLKEFNNNIQKEVTLLLQNLQWDPKLITEKYPMVTCKCDSNHRILPEIRDAHEQQCQLTKLGYRKEDSFLPDPIDLHATTLVKFSKHEITGIINNAAIIDPSFKRGVGCEGLEPLTMERLQRAYSADERRAIHDAVVRTAPFCHDLTDLDLLSSNNGMKESEKKSRLEILAELRNMKRRRTKYRVAPKTRNYSDVLRDVIKTQMDSYGETTRTIIKTEYGPNCYVSQKVNTSTFEPHNIKVKQERDSPEIHNKYQRQESRESYRGRSKEMRQTDDRPSFRKDDYLNNEQTKTHHARNENSEDSKVERNRDRRRDDERCRHKDRYSSKERSRNYEDHRSHYGRSREKRYNDERHLYSSRDSSRDYERVIKQERASSESETYASSSKYHNRDLSKSINEDCSDNKYYGKERKDQHRKRHSPNKYQLARESSPNESYRDKETSRKRHRSRSREKRHKDKKKRHDKDKHCSMRGKKHDSRNGEHYYLSNTIIKQERESP